MHMSRTKIDPEFQAQMDRLRFAARRIMIRDEELDRMRPYDITPPDPERLRNTWKMFLRKMGWDEEETGGGPDNIPE